MSVFNPIVWTFQQGTQGGTDPRNDRQVTHLYGDNDIIEPDPTDREEGQRS